MRSRIPPVCPASPDYQQGVSSAVAYEKEHKKNFIASCDTTMVDMALSRDSEISIVNCEKDQSESHNKRISEGVLVCRTLENTSRTRGPDGKPRPTKSYNAPGDEVKRKTGNNAQPLSTASSQFMTGGVEHSAIKSGRGCHKRFAVWEEESRRDQATGKRTKIATASDTYRIKDFHENDHLDIDQKSLAKKRRGTRLNGRFRQPNFDTGEKEQHQLRNAISSSASVQVCAPDRTEKKVHPRSLDTITRKSRVMNALEFMRTNDDDQVSASGSESNNFENVDGRKTVLPNATEPVTPGTQPLQMDTHISVELVMKLWKPLPPASSFLGPPKSVIQELKEVLVDREEPGESIALPPPFPSDIESRAFIFACMSPSVQTKVGRDNLSPVLLPCLSREGSVEQEHGETCLCASPSGTSTAVSTPAETRSFTCSPGVCDNVSKLSRARKIHRRAVSREENASSVCRFGEAVRGDVSETPLLPTSVASSRESPVRNTEMEQRGKLFVLETESTLTPSIIHGDSPLAEKGCSRQVQGMVVDPVAYDQQRERTHVGAPSNSPEIGVRFSHVDIVSVDRHSLRRKEGPCGKKVVLVNGRGGKASSSTQQTCEKKEQPSPSLKGAEVTVEDQRNGVRQCLVSDKNCPGDEDHLMHQTHTNCQLMHALGTKETYEGFIDTSCGAMKTRSGRQVKLNLTRFPGLRASGEPVPA